MAKKTEQISFRAQYYTKASQYDLSEPLAETYIPNTTYLASKQYGFQLVPQVGDQVSCVDGELLVTQRTLDLDTGIWTIELSESSISAQTKEEAMAALEKWRKQMEDDGWTIEIIDDEDIEPGEEEH